MHESTTESHGRMRAVGWGSDMHMIVLGPMDLMLEDMLNVGTTCCSLQDWLVLLCGMNII